MKSCIKCGNLERYKNGDCKICARIRCAKWRKANPDKMKTIFVAWQIANREKVKVYKRAWQIANREKVKTRTNKWRIINQEKIKKQTAIYFVKWRKANPKIMRIYKQNRRARELSAGGMLSKGLSERLYKRQKGKCVCCHKPLNNDYHLDHIMPLVLGGKNEDWNIQLLRAECNSRKGVKHPVIYMQKKGFLL